MFEKYILNHNHKNVLLGNYYGNNVHIINYNYALLGVS